MQKKVAYQISKVLVPGPRTVRGLPSSLDISKDRLLYFNSCAVFIIQKQKLTLTFYHTNDVTAAAFSNNGRYVASGDEKGNVLIYEVLEDRVVQFKSFENLLGGIIRGIDWTGDHNKIIVVGEGKTNFGRVINIDTGTNVGQIVGVTSTITTACFRPERPFKLVLGGEEKVTKFYDGPPYKFDKSQSAHTGVINHIRYERKGEFIASVSSDKKIAIYEGKTGAILKQKINTHEGGITGVDWIDHKTLVTSSNDKTVKIWDSELQQLATLKIKQNSKIEDFQVAVRVNGKDIYSVSLNGNINLWKDPLTTKQTTPTQVIEGWIAKPLRLITGNDTFYMYDSSGKVFYYNSQTGRLHTFKSDKQAKVIVGGDLSDKSLYVLQSDENLRRYECNTNTFVEEYSVGPFGQISANKNNSREYVLAGNSLAIFEEKTQKTSVKLDYDVTALNWGLFIAVGSQKGLVYLYNESLTLVNTLANGSYRISALTSEGNILYTGDSSRLIKLWDVKQAKIFSTDVGNHNALVTDIFVGKQTILTCGLDNKFAVWNKQTFKRQQQILDHHKKGVTSIISFNGQVVTTGGDYLVKFIKFNRNVF